MYESQLGKRNLVVAVSNKYPQFAYVALRSGGYRCRRKMCTTRRLHPLGSTLTPPRSLKRFTSRSHIVFSLSPLSGPSTKTSKIQFSSIFSLRLLQMSTTTYHPRHRLRALLSFERPLPLLLASRFHRLGHSKRAGSVASRPLVLLIPVISDISSLGQKSSGVSFPDTMMVTSGRPGL